MVKNLLANTGDTRDAGLTPGSGSSLGVENGNPLHYSCLQNSMKSQEPEMKIVDSVFNTENSVQRLQVWPCSEA